MGIDIGTTTTQLVISKIVFLNHNNPFLVPDYKITEKEVIYQGKIYNTPLLNENTLSIIKIAEIIEMEYQNAGIGRKEIATGAVIITGDTARKENAEAVLHGISDFAGDFVVATAGSTLESIISGKGAGADLRSEREAGITANLDIGGGTTNISVFENGKLLATKCVDVGGSLIRFEQTENKIDYIADLFRRNLENHGIIVKKRQLLKSQDELKIAQAMVTEIEKALKDLEKEIHNKIDSLSFSGGVSDLLNDYQGKDRDFRDMGNVLAKAIRNSMLFKNYRICISDETIRATVIGAGSHTTEISGSTIHLKNIQLPIKNSKVIAISALNVELYPEEIGNKIQTSINQMILENDEKNIALSIQVHSNLPFHQLLLLGQEIVRGTKELQKDQVPLIIFVNCDIAKALGQTLTQLLDKNYPVICIDGIKCTDDDYVDIGKSLAGESVVPVVVKSLIWN